MSVSDIKYLVNYVLDGTSFKRVFIKSKIKAAELNKTIELIKKQYVKGGLTKNNNKSISKDNYNNPKIIKKK